MFATKEGRSTGRFDESLIRLAIPGFIALGILFRVRQYLFNRSLWLDECALALNILRRTPAGLIKNLSDDQAAPVVFLWLEKIAVHFFGTGERALRLTPLLAGIGALFLFAELARRLLSPRERTIAVGLFCLCGPLIYYSTELKQYSTDVAAALALYLMMSPLLKEDAGPFTFLRAAAIGAAAVWVSFPAAFVLGGIGLGAIWTALRNRDRRALAGAGAAIAAWISSFAAYFATSLKPLTGTRSLLGYWKGEFAPISLSSPAAALWYPNAFFRLFSYPVGQAFAGIAAVAAILGTIRLRRTFPALALALTLPAGIALIASALRLYPFEGRLLLFLVPSAIFLIAEGLGSIDEIAARSIPFLGALLTTLLFFYPAVDAVGDCVRPHGVEELRSAIDYVQEHRSPSDSLYCYYGAQAGLEYYALRGVLKPIKTTIGVAGAHEWNAYRDDLDRLRGRGRVWFLFSHVWRRSGVDEELLFVDYLNGIGTQLASHHVTGAAAYLYDLGGSAPFRARHSRNRADPALDRERLATVNWACDENSSNCNHDCGVSPIRWTDPCWGFWVQARILWRGDGQASAARLQP